MNSKFVNAEFYSKVVNLLHKGFGSKRISQEFNTTQTTLHTVLKTFADTKAKKLLQENNKCSRQLIIPSRVLNFIYNELNQVVYFIFNGWTTTNITKSYNISPQTLKKVLTKTNYIKRSSFNKEFLELCWIRLKKNNKQMSRINGVKNGSKKRKFHNNLMPTIRKLLNLGMSSKMMKNFFYEQNINICHTSIINIIKKYGMLEDLKKLKTNAKTIQAETVKALMKTKTSKPEQMLRDIVQSYFPAAEWKFAVKGSKDFYWEIDVALVDKQIGFEYDCTFWHNKQRDEARDKDLKKMGWTIYRFIYTKNPTKEELLEEFLNTLKSIPELS